MAGLLVYILLAIVADVEQCAQPWGSFPAVTRARADKVLPAMFCLLGEMLAAIPTKKNTQSAIRDREGGRDTWTLRTKRLE